MDTQLLKDILFWLRVIGVTLIMLTLVTIILVYFLANSGMIPGFSLPFHPSR